MKDTLLWDRLKNCHKNKPRETIEKEGCIIIEGNSIEEIKENVKKKFGEVTFSSYSKGYAMIGDSYIYFIEGKGFEGLLEINNYPTYVNSKWEGLLVIEEIK